MGFFYGKVNSSLFIYRANSLTVLLLVNIDDVIVAGDNYNFITQIIKKLGSEFAIKDLGN